MQSHEAYPCSKDGRERIRRAITEQKLDRVLIAGCAPRLVEKLFRQAVESVLDPAYVNIADIREQVAYVHPDDSGGAAQGQRPDRYGRGTARDHQRSAHPSRTGCQGGAGDRIRAERPDGGIEPRRRGPACDPAGGIEHAWRRLCRACTEGTCRLLAEKSELVLRHPMIDTLFNARLMETSGHPGDYEVRIQQGDQSVVYSVGAIVISNNAQPRAPGSLHWYDRARVKTQAEFEIELQAADCVRQDEPAQRHRDDLLRRGEPAGTLLPDMLQHGHPSGHPGQTTEPGRQRHRVLPRTLSGGHRRRRTRRN